MRTDIHENVPPGVAKTVPLQQGGSGLELPVVFVGALNEDVPAYEAIPGEHPEWDARVGRLQSRSEAAGQVEKQRSGVGSTRAATVKDDVRGGLHVWHELAVLVPSVGFEPTTDRVETGCSIP